MFFPAICYGAVKGIQKLIRPFSSFTSFFSKPKHAVKEKRVIEASNNNNRSTQVICDSLQLKSASQDVKNQSSPAQDEITEEMQQKIREEFELTQHAKQMFEINKSRQEVIRKNIGEILSEHLGNSKITGRWESFCNRIARREALPWEGTFFNDQPVQEIIRMVLEKTQDKMRQYSVLVVEYCDIVKNPTFQKSYRQEINERSEELDARYKEIRDADEKHIERMREMGVPVELLSDERGFGLVH